MVFIEVIIAVAFVFFLSSTLVSGINELINMLMNKRGNELHKAIGTLLNEADPSWGDRFYGHPVIASLQEQARWVSVRALKQRLLKLFTGDNSKIKFNPSYISSQHFAEVLTDFLSGINPGASVTASNSSLSSDELEAIRLMRTFINASDENRYMGFVSTFIESNNYPFEVVNKLKAEISKTGALPAFNEFKKTVNETLDAYLGENTRAFTNSDILDLIKLNSNHLPDTNGAQAIYSFIQRSESYDKLQERLTTWYDGYMNRVSGWYKRKMQFAVIWIATITVLALNLDAIEITKAIYRDSSLREHIVATAEQYSESEFAVATRNDSIDQDSIKRLYHKIQANIDSIETLGIPMYWNLTEAEKECKCNRMEAIGKKLNWQKILGLLLMVLAISMGAPFWFDVFNKFLKVRSTGKAETQNSANQGQQSSNNPAPGGNT